MQWWLRFLFVVFLVAPLHDAAKAERRKTKSRNKIDASLECSCVESDDVSLDLRCHRVPVQGTHTPFPEATPDMKYTTFSCDFDPRQPSKNNFNGYKLIPGLGYYKYYSELKNWDDGSRTCRSEGAHLLIIDSEPELEAVMKIFRENPAVTGNVWDSFSMWLGVTDFVKEGEFIDLLGKPFQASAWLKWYSGQPDNLEEEDCLAIRRDGALNDDQCHNRRPFICEKE